MRLQFTQVDFDDLVEVLLGIGVHLGVAGQMFLDAVGQGRNVRAAGRFEVALHARIVAEGRGGCPDLSAHVADGAFACAAQRFSAVAEVFDDASGAALNGQHTGHLQDHVFRRGPTGQASRQFDADELREFQLPRHAGHHVHGVGTAHTHGHHAQSTGIHRVRIRTDHHATREGVVLEDHLVDDARTGLPEADAVFVGHGLEEVVDFVVLVDGLLQVRIRLDLRLNQVVAVHR